MRPKLADHDCWANMPLPDIGNTRTLLGNAEPIGTRAPRRMLVPVPIPEGTRYEGFFGAETELLGDADMASIPTMKKLP